MFLSVFRVPELVFLLYIHVRTSTVHAKKPAKILQIFHMTKYFLKKNQKKCIFALFRWHFSQLGLHKLGNYATEIRL